jgi:hypothetical protein
MVDPVLTGDGAEAGPADGVALGLERLFESPLVVRIFRAIMLQEPRRDCADMEQRHLEAIAPGENFSHVPDSPQRGTGTIHGQQNFLHSRHSIQRAQWSGLFEVQVWPVALSCAPRGRLLHPR